MTRALLLAALAALLHILPTLSVVMMALCVGLTDQIFAVLIFVVSCVALYKLHKACGTLDKPNQTKP